MNRYNIVFNNQEKAKENWLEKNKEQKAKAYADMEEMTELIRKDPDMFKKYLELQSKFNRYSSGNCLILLKNCPNAKQFKEREEWKRDGITVNKDAKGFTFLKAHTKDDVTYFNAKTAYDISETDAIVEEKVYNFNDNKLATAFLNSCSVYVELKEEMENGLCAKYDKEQSKLFIAKNIDDRDEFFNQLSQELAYIQLSNEMSSEYKNFKAYCISYMICNKYGIDTSKYNFNSLPKEFISQDSTQSIREELNKIRESFEKINNRIYDNLQKSVKQKEKKNVEVR